MLFKVPTLDIQFLWNSLYMGIEKLETEWINERNPKKSLALS